MNSGLYLIHEDDYITHIDDKVEMYGLLLALAQEAREKITAGRITEALCVLAGYEKEAAEAFEAWGIPESYIESGDEDELAELLENELLPPEDVCCEGAPCCLAADEYDDDDFDGYIEESGEEKTSIPAELLEITKSLTENAKRTLQLCTQMMEEY